MGSKIAHSEAASQACFGLGPNAFVRLGERTSLHDLLPLGFVYLGWRNLRAASYVVGQS